MAAAPTMDLDSLVSMFENATARQGEQLRKAASDATLAALQGRELTLKNIKAALKSVSEAAGAGAMKNVAGADAEALLDSAVSGMDDALVKAVEAHRVALQQFVSQGADLRDKHLKKAIDDLDRLEDTMFAAMKKAGAAGQMPEAWAQVLEKMQSGGTAAGVQAATTVQQMAEQMQAAVRQGRHAGLRAAQAMAESYAAMASGVLLGMSEAMRAAPAAKPRRK